ncbi:MAG: dienelactone hydrolase family protein [Caulobacteraceae bacterium]
MRALGPCRQRKSGLPHFNFAGFCSCFDDARFEVRLHGKITQKTPCSNIAVLDEPASACDGGRMADKINLTSKIDGFGLAALSALPKAKPIGGVVVIQEIFGLTGHIREMCGVFADEGYHAVAPGLFERIEKNFHAEHDQDGVQKGVAAVMKSPWPQVVSDIQAAIDALPKPTYVTGFCYGGAASWMAASHCNGVSAASCFYGRLIATLLDHKPKIPTMLHYGARDPSIPLENVESVRLAALDSPLYLYDAGHGFCRAGSSDHDAAACDLSLARTLDWFARWH